MKKMVMLFVLIASLAVIHLGGHAYAQAKWKLYDNFNKSNTINTNKWSLPAGDLASYISIENGRVKFQHPQNLANISVWLGINQAPDTITGIKATVTIDSAAGDSLRARVGAWTGDFGDDRDPVWTQTCVQFRSLGWGGDRLFSSASVLERAPFWPWLADLNWSGFWSPLDTIGESFIIELVFDYKGYAYGVDGFGKGTFKFPEKLEKGLPIFAGIGTRSDSNASSGTVYFDDVYVLRGLAKDKEGPKVKSVFPKNDARNVPIDTEVVITFNEPMTNGFWGGDIFPKGTKYVYQYPQTFVFYPAFDPGKWINLKFKKGAFRDAVGNPSASYSFKFRTEVP